MDLEGWLRPKLEHGGEGGGTLEDAELAGVDTAGI